MRTLTAYDLRKISGGVWEQVETDNLITVTCTHDKIDFDTFNADKNRALELSQEKPVHFTWNAVQAGPHGAKTAYQFDIEFAHTPPSYFYYF